MKFLDLTLDTAAANIAFDEAILEFAESGELDDEVLRVWQTPSPIVVLGRSSSISIEVNRQFCNSENIPIIRRCSGGSTILTAPGCLMYAVLLNYDRWPKLRLLDKAHEFVMSKIQAAISQCGAETDFQGTCDLTIDNKKVSGNALRCKKNWLIYHGTLICENMDLRLISKCLGTPKREPEYRQGRVHANFLTHIPVNEQLLKTSLYEIWNCDSELQDWPISLTNELVRKKYTSKSWNEKI